MTYDTLAKIMTQKSKNGNCNIEYGLLLLSLQYIDIEKTIPKRCLSQILCLPLPCH